MKQDVFHFRVLVLLAVLGGGWTNLTPVVADQGEGVRKMDGQNTEWGLSETNAKGDVNPIQIDGIDIWKVDSHFGQLYQTKEDFERSYIPPEVFKDEEGRTHKRFLPPTNWSIGIALEVAGELFSGTEESSIEIFFDVYPERDHGVSQEPWHDFRPDYRFELRGKDGRIETEGYYTWEDDKWAGEQLADTPEFVAAIGGAFFECLIPWTSLGAPVTRDEEVPGKANMLLMAWAIRIKQEESTDYYPDPQYSQYWEISGARGIAYNDVFVETSVEGHSWGKVKQEKDKQNKGEQP